MATPEVIAHDDLCPVCQLLLYVPVRTQCNHLLCASCMAQWADISSTTNIEHSSLDVDLSDFDPSYDPTYDLEAKCPMCRTPTTACPDNTLALGLERKYPGTYIERKAEEDTAKGERFGEGGVEGMMILIGNRHRNIRGEETANTHDWTFFVRVSRPDLVEEVRINLHPTFSPPRVVCREPPFEVRRCGWGIFKIEARIILKEPYGWVKDGGIAKDLALDWMLDFEGRGRQGRVRAKIKKSHDEALGDGNESNERPISPVRWPHMDDS